MFNKQECMKVLAVTFLFSVMSFMTIGQDLKPVTWEFRVNEVEDGSYNLVATAKIKGDWAIYSQHTQKGGPIPLSFTYEKGVKLNGETKELSSATKKMSDLFEVEVVKFTKEAVFEQNFRPEAGVSSIKGSLRFMCCDELRCLPPADVAFDVAL